MKPNAEIESGGAAPTAAAERGVHAAEASATRRSPEIPNPPSRPTFLRPEGRAPARPTAAAERGVHAAETSATRSPSAATTLLPLS